MNPQPKPKKSKAQKQANNGKVVTTVARTPRKNVSRFDPASHKQRLLWKVPDCAVEYFATLCDPFNASPGACLPADVLPLPSQKVRTFARVRMALGTTGFGFACYTPVGSNDQAILQYTTATSVGTSATLFNAYTNLANANNTQGPFTGANITGGDISWRLVAGGLRIKYIGAASLSNGVTIGVEHQDHRNARTMSWDILNTNPYSIIQRVGPSTWDSAVCSSGPVTPQELEWSNSSYIPSPAADAGYVLIAVSGTPGDIYEAEVFQHVEYIGTLCSSKSRSHSDPSSYSKIVDTVKNQTAIKPLAPADAPTLFEKFKTALAENLPTIVSTGVGIARIASGDVLGGGAMILSGAAAAAPRPQLRLSNEMQSKILAPQGRQRDREALVTSRYAGY